MILALTVKILNQSVWNFYMKKRLNVVYRPTTGKTEPFENFLKILLKPLRS